MNVREIKLRQIIADFESRTLGGQAAIDQIKALTGEVVDIGYLREYGASESLDAFVKKLLAEPINDWKAIDDRRAIEMIDEIKRNVTDDPIIHRNSSALEKRYAKSAGTVVSKIFHENIESSAEILEALKKETRIFL
jgi:hypothetical protein